jgi:hypothetical protein
MSALINFDANLRLHAHLCHHYKYQSTVVRFGIKAHTEMALIPTTKRAWRQSNIQQAREFLTIPKCHNIINFASHEQLRTVHAFPLRKGRGFSSKPSGETTEVNDPRAICEFVHCAEMRVMEIGD